MRITLTALLVLFLYFSASAQIIEGFNSPVKGSYADGQAPLPSGNWYFAESLIGNLDGDHKFGSHSVRMGSALPGFGSRVQMQFDLDGAGQVSFYHGSYKTDGNSGRHSVIQLQQSTNGGFQWTNVGGPITTSNTFDLQTFDVDYDGTIRFRIVKIEGGSAGSRNHRVNIDDFTVTEFFESFADARLALNINDEQSDLSGDLAVDFGKTVSSSEIQASFTITNTGQATLSGNATLSSQNEFTFDSQTDFTLGFRESQEITVAFESQDAGNYTANLELSSNDPENPVIVVELTAEVLNTDTTIPISQARDLPFGTIATVSGWVSTANEFGGPIFIQDNTAGIAVFFNPLHSAVQRGDSVVVTGPITEFNPTGNNEGTFLRQISGSSVQFSVHPEGRKTVTPRTVTLEAMNDGCCESELIRLVDVEFTVSGNFPTNTQNFTIRQNGESAAIRIDTRSNFAGAPIPVGSVTIVGIVDRFNGTYQLKPRDTNDLGVEEFENPFADVSKDETFDVATWNIEWFGNSSNGPDDTQLQFNNVKQVIETMDLDLYALQEISNVQEFYRLVDALDEYSGFVANYGQTQKVAYLFKTAVIDSITSGFVATGSRWANGRFPFMFEFDATINAETRRIRSINFHAKAFASQSDYDQRVTDARELKRYTDSRKATDNLIILGDFNDDVIESTWAGLTSPYQPFNDDPDYTIVTRTLSEMGFTSYRSISNIDHIMINSGLYSDYLYGSEQIENTGYIGSYLTTTSDHYPVWSRFKFVTDTSIDNPQANLPFKNALESNYPNPFNPSTTLYFTLADTDQVTLKVYDMTGRVVSVLLNNIQFTGGSHQVAFNADDLSSGVYLYTIQTLSGFTATQKMVLLK
jgi:endonuclease/exonuclease/phosphatase family metal-dependent hydrolase